VAALTGSIIKRKINLLLLVIPLVIFRAQLLAQLKGPLEGLLGENVELARNLAVFVLAAAALIPLAGFVESAVEELAELLGPFVGGLLHTTFGNVAELTIALSVLLSFAGSGGSEIVLGSIAGVIIRNSLLFLGISTLFGAWRNGRMKFDAENASEYTTVFALAVIGLSLPTIASLVLSSGGEGGEGAAAGGGEGIHTLFLPKHIPFVGLLAVVLLLSYLAYIGFAVFRLGEGYNLVEQRIQRRLHRRRAREERRRQRAGLPLVAQPDTQALFAEERETAERRLEGLETGGQQPGRVYARAGMLEHKRRIREERGERGLFHAHPVLRFLVALLVLGIATAGVAAMSESFAKSVEEVFSANPDLQRFEFFLGLILIPVLAGLVELYGSVGAARENRIEITMAVTAGATIQMILLIVPVLVLVGLVSGHPLDLVFQPLHIIIFGASTFIFMLLARDGESTWLEGAQLCTLWSLVAVIALFLPPGG
jgi:Ca2+:H+ antiporter